jgi:hypothetical protein
MINNTRDVLVDRLALRTNTSWKFSLLILGNPFRCSEARKLGANDEAEKMWWNVKSKLPISMLDLDNSSSLLQG